LLVGVGRRNFSDKDYREILENKNFLFTKNVEVKYYQAGFTEKDSLKDLHLFLDKTEKNESNSRIFYLATSHVFFENILKQISKCCVHKNGNPTKIMIEKPFGEDLKSFEKLNKIIKKQFFEEQIYRIDHYLAKETVENILVLRMSNPFLERTWNSEFIEKISIIVDEEKGIGRRIEYYDKTGAIRDMVQNHLLQILSFILMKPPKTTNPKDIHSEKAKAIKKVYFTGKAILGQYEGYKEEAKKIGNPDSKTETYAEINLKTKDSSWKNTDILLRTGKQLKKKEAKIEIIYKKEPCLLYCNIDTNPNKLVLNIQPEQDVELCINTKTPGTEFEVSHETLSFSPTKKFDSNTPQNYELLLWECIKGDKTLFISETELREAWKTVDDIRNKVKNNKIIAYKKGSNRPILTIS
jgi:glucose-6-phosphate 1-dehydrogenase